MRQPLGTTVPLEANREALRRLSDQGPMVEVNGRTQITTADACLHAALGPVMTTRDEWAELGAPTLLDVEGEQHRRMRKALNELYTRQRVAQFAPALRQRAAALIGGVAERDGCDALPLIYRYALAAMLEFFGFPPRDRAEITDLLKALDVAGVAVHTATDRRSFASNESKIYSCMARLKDLVQRALLTGGLRPNLQWLTARGLTLTEATGYFVFNFSVWRNTPACIVHALYELRDPDLRDLLRRDPGQLGAFVEEAIRLASPVSALPRTTTAPMDVGGKTLPAGKALDLCFRAANLDSGDRVALSDDGQRVLRRKHIAFGVGHHRCLGIHLARLEVAVFIEEWLRRIPDFTTTEGFTPEIVNDHFEHLTALPLRWDTDETI